VAWRWLLHSWFALIGVSVLTTYQHHFIDLPTGALAGWLCVWFWPDEGRSPLLAARLTRQPQRLKLALFYGIGALLLATPVFAQVTPPPIVPTVPAVVPTLAPPVITVPTLSDKQAAQLDKLLNGDIVAQGLARLGAQALDAAGRVIARQGGKVDARQRLEQPCGLPVFLDRAARADGGGASLEGGAVHADTADPVEIERIAGIALVGASGLQLLLVGRFIR
jgi:hypothetical protein